MPRSWFVPMLLLAWPALSTALRADDRPTATAAAAEGTLASGASADAEVFRGRLAGAATGWKLRFAEGDKEREVAGADLARWGTFAEPARETQIVLAGGGLLVASSALRIDAERLQGDSLLLEKIELPLEAIAGIIVRPPLDRQAQDALYFRIVSPGGQSDRVLLDNGDEVAGTLARLDPDSLKLQTDAGEVSVEMRRVVAIVFNPSLVNKPRTTGLRGLVGLRDGSRLTAMELVADKETSTIKLAPGAELKVPTEVISAILMLGGRATYLSDLKPVSYRHVPYLQLPWRFQVDRSVAGAQLRAGSKLFPKGLGMHSPARITYELDGEYRRFAAELAVDDETALRGSVLFRVFTDDGDGTWNERAASQVVRGGELPVPLSVDVTGAKRISLLVDPADRGDELDHADWLGARLVR